MIERAYFHAFRVRRYDIRLFTTDLSSVSMILLGDRGNRMRQNIWMSCIRIGAVTHQRERRPDAISARTPSHSCYCQLNMLLFRQSNWGLTECSFPIRSYTVQCVSSRPWLKATTKQSWRRRAEQLRLLVRRVGNTHSGRERRRRMRIYCS